MVTIEMVLDPETNKELEQLKSCLAKACFDIETMQDCHNKASSSSTISSQQQQQQQQQRSTNDASINFSDAGVNNSNHNQYPQSNRPLRTQTAAVVGGFMFSLAKDLASSTTASANNNNNNNNTKSRHSALGTNNNKNDNDNTKNTTTRGAFTASTLWNNALSVIEKTKEIHQAERSFAPSKDVQISHVVGDTRKASTVGFVIHGFMTLEDTNIRHLWDDWAATLNMVVYRIEWPTGSKESWNQLFQKLSSSSSSSNTNHNVTPALWASNPFHVAQDMTFQVAHVLSRFLEEMAILDTKNNHSTHHNSGRGRRPIVLIGHSLGAAIAYHTLLQERRPIHNHPTSDPPLVDHVVCLAGAFIPPSKEEFHKSLKRVRGTFINVYSKNDQVLQVGYRMANFTRGNPAGCTPLHPLSMTDDDTSSSKLVDMDMTTHIPMEERTMYGHHYSTQTLNWIATQLQDTLWK